MPREEVVSGFVVVNDVVEGGVDLVVDMVTGEGDVVIVTGEVIFGVTVSTFAILF
jgi:hypothetical protein